MFTNQSVHESASSLRAVISAATRGLVEREALVEMVALSAVAEEHVLVIGPPGTMIYVRYFTSGPVATVSAAVILVTYIWTT